MRRARTARFYKNRTQISKKIVSNGHNLLSGRALVGEMRTATRTITVLATLPLAGCSATPTLYMFGSYFPAWMLCGALGVAASLTARAAFIATGFAEGVPHQLLVCSAIGLSFALVVWLVFYG
jgi:hypothetical protein